MPRLLIVYSADTYLPLPWQYDIERKLNKDNFLKTFCNINGNRFLVGMDRYDGACEKLKDMDFKRDNVDLDDFEEFMRKVEEVNKMVHALTSNNKSEIEEASKKAAVWLKSHSKKKSNAKEMHEEIINDCKSSQPKVIVNKTVINKEAFKEEKKEGLNNLNCESMSQEEFMKSVEEDAKKRSEDRKERKIKSDVLKEKAKKAFLENDFEKALDWYNKAIEVRKDSHVLYTNRALTLLKLGLNTRVVHDCETALKLDESNFKAAVYKGKAYFQMNEKEKADEWLEKVKKMFPHRISEIIEYHKSWNDENSDGN